MKIALLLPVMSDSRSHRRIRALKNLGVHPVILAFERKYYKGNPISGGYASLGHIEHSKYYKRLIPFLRVLCRVRAQVKEADAIYAFGLDMLLLGRVACLGLPKPLKAVYEVADIREVLLGKGLFSCCLRWLERFLLRRTDLIVVTSEAFISGYYREIQRLTTPRYLVIENKLDTGLLAQIPASSDNKSDEIIRIGYFGVIRCRRSLEILQEAAKQGSGRVQVYIRGFPLGVGDLENEVRNNPYIKYDGPYVAPDDLPTLYSQIDVVWACYPYQGNGIGNYLWARTNRFYESCCFKRPMLAQKGTEDGRLIEALGLGMCLNLSDIKEAVECILSITRTMLNQWQEAISQLSQDVYVLTDEHERLLEMLKSSKLTDMRLQGAKNE